MKIGAGYRREISGWIATKPVECLEVTAEHFFREHDQETLASLAENYPIYVHGLGLSLGTEGPLDAQILRQFARVAEVAKAEWVSEHVAFTWVAGMDLGHLNPVQTTREMAHIIAEHAREISDFCGRPIILENITSHLRLEGDLSETDFLNTICEQADCGLLLDVTNLYINSRNHGFDPVRWLEALDSRRITQLHIVGYTEVNGRLADGHGEAIQPELLALTREITSRASVKAIILERDTDFPEADDLDREIAKIRAARDGD